MYELINRNARKIVQNLARETNVVSEYEWLLEHTSPQHIGSEDYQKRYKSYWEVNLIRPSKSWVDAYFATLHGAVQNGAALQSVVEQIFATPVHSNGKKSVQFSFASKLLHMTQPSLPIYDSFVAEFYFFSPPSVSDPQKKIFVYLEFHNFLVEETARIRKDDLVKPAIAEFRSHFIPKCCSDQKIIDSLIWSFVDLLHKREIQY